MTCASRKDPPALIGAEDAALDHSSTHCSETICSRSLFPNSLSHEKHSDKGEDEGPRCSRDQDTQQTSFRRAPYIRQKPPLCLDDARRRSAPDLASTFQVGRNTPS